MQAEAGEDSSQVQQELSAAEVALDRCLLKLFSVALRADKLQQALEVACQLQQQRALEGAIQLANHNRQPALSDRIATFLQNRLDLEAAEAEQAGSLSHLPSKSLSRHTRIDMSNTPLWFRFHRRVMFWVILDDLCVADMH